MINRISAQNSSSSNRKVTSSTSAPGNAGQGDFWYKTDTDSLFIYYDNVWVEVGGAQASLTAHPLAY